MRATSTEFNANRDDRGARFSRALGRRCSQWTEQTRPRRSWRSRGQQWSGRADV